MKKFSKNVSIGMSQELYDALKELAEKDFRSVPSYIRQLLQNHVKNLPRAE